MKTCILLLLFLEFIQFGLSCDNDVNITGDEKYPVCKVEYFRAKRAIEYTRWRAQDETSSEFIVKVLDDDVPTSKAVVGVNVESLVATSPRIIVGGAVLPSASPKAPVSPAGLPNEYTRFIQPSRSAKNLFSPLALTAITPLMPPRTQGVNTKLPVFLPNVVRNPLRDESPPVSPLFVPRQPTSTSPAGVQYAPVVQVAFNRRNDIKPLAPPTTNRYTQQGMKTNNLDHPDRSSPVIVSSYHLPIRTTSLASEEMYDFRQLGDVVTSNDIVFTRTEGSPITSPARTPAISNFNSLLAEVFEKFQQMKEDKVSDPDQLVTPPIHMPTYTTTLTTSKKHYMEDENDYEIFDDYTHDYKKPYDHKSESINNFKSENEEDSISIERNDTENENEKSENVTDSNSNVDEVYQDVTSPRLSIAARDEKIQTVPILDIKSDSGRRRYSPCNIVRDRSITFNTSATLQEIINKIKVWGETSPLVEWIDITNGNLTTMENPIMMLIVDDPSTGQSLSAKETVMIVAGIQGRDHHTVAAAMYVLYRLVERSDSHVDLLTRFRFWIIPVFNPDGYEYSMNFPRHRDWKKNLRQNWELCKDQESKLDSCKSCELYGLRCFTQPCYGVHLDRNFEYQWIPSVELKAEHPCGDLYAGQRQLSEPETFALTHYLHEQRKPLQTFIAFKEGDVLGVMYPYSHTRKRRAFDHIYRQRALSAAAAAYSINGRPYVAGQTSEFLPLFAGGIEDWIDGHLGIENTYSVVLFRPADALTAKLKLERVVHEAYAAMDTLLMQKTTEPLRMQDNVDIVRQNPNTLRRAISGSRRCRAQMIVTAVVTLSGTSSWFALNLLAS